MSFTPKAEPSAAVQLEAPARWEQRSTDRVIEAGRDQLLERSRKMVEAAYELLEQDGLEGLTIRAVLKKTRLSRRAFYERFAGKDDLMLAVFEQTIRLATRLFAEQAAALPDPMQRLQMLVTHIVLGKGAYASVDNRSNRRSAALQPLIELIARLLSDGMDAGAVRRTDPQRLAALVYNLVSTTVHTELLAHESTQPDRSHRAELAADIWEFCRRAIAA
jgi:AcrR family transcriptional regulator